MIKQEFFEKFEEFLEKAFESGFTPYEISLKAEKYDEIMQSRIVTTETIYKVRG
jgi:hypothetical protein